MPGKTSSMRFMGMENCLKLQTSDHKPVRAMFDVTIPRTLHLQPCPTIESPCLFLSDLSLSLTRKELEEVLEREEAIIKERSASVEEQDPTLDAQVSPKKDKGKREKAGSTVAEEAGRLDPYVKFYVDPPELLGDSIMMEDMFHNVKMKMPRTAVMNTHWDVARKEPVGYK
jgi:hypothetical protein